VIFLFTMSTLSRMSPAEGKLNDKWCYHLKGLLEVRQAMYEGGCVGPDAYPGDMHNPVKDGTRAP